MSTTSNSATGAARGSLRQSNLLAISASYIPKKRPRPTLSCVECRKKKLKCDRLRPCNQCTRTETISQCVYQNREATQAQSHHVRNNPKCEWEHGVRVSNTRARQRQPFVPRDSVADYLLFPSTGDSQTSKNLEELQARVLDLEVKLSVNVELNSPAVSQASSMPTQVTLFDHDHEENANWTSANHKGILTSMGNRIRYFGPNHKLALLNHFDNVMDFCHRGLPGLSDLMPECKQFQRMITPKRRAVTTIPALSNSATLSRLIGLLPPRVVCDQLVATYFYACEKSLRVLHLPCFLRECQQFWHSGAQSRSTYAGFVPQLYAVVLVGSCWDESNVLRKHLDSHNVTEGTISKLIECWLTGLELKSHIDLSTLRIRCCLYMCHVIYLSAPRETIWSNVGTTVRSAMTIGFHRDPNEFSNISIFEGEQRRRLWATIIEIDLQSSLMSDSPAIIRDGEYNCLPPANIDDLQLYEEMTEYPVSKPLNEWTDATLQILLVKWVFSGPEYLCPNRIDVLNRSFPLRLKVASISSQIREQPDYGTYLELGGQIEDYLNDLPASAKFDAKLPVGLGRLVGHMNLDRFIRRALVCLYRPFILGISDDTKFLEGRRACVRNALAILDQQDFWDPDVADLKIVNSRAYWDAYYRTSRIDVMQAALTVCLEIKALSEASSREGATERQTMHNQVVWNSQTSNWTKVSLTKTVENTLRCLLRRLDDPLTDLRDALALSMALQASRLSRDQATTDSLMIAGATTVIKACRQHFFGSESAVSSSAKQPSTKLSSPFPATPLSLGESRDLIIEDGLVTPFDGISLPLDVDIDVAPFDVDVDIYWDWGETWR